MSLFYFLFYKIKFIHVYSSLETFPSFSYLTRDFLLENFSFSLSREITALFIVSLREGQFFKIFPYFVKKNWGLVYRTERSQQKNGKIKLKKKKSLESNNWIRMKIWNEDWRMSSIVFLTDFRKVRKSHRRIIDLLSSDVWRRLRSVRLLSFHTISLERKNHAKEENYVPRPHHS